MVNIAMLVTYQWRNLFVVVKTNLAYYKNSDHHNLEQKWNYTNYMSNMPIYIYIYIHIAILAEWSRSAEIRLSICCCSVSMSLVQIHGGWTTIFQNTVVLNFQAYIYINLTFCYEHSLSHLKRPFYFNAHCLFFTKLYWKC